MKKKIIICLLALHLCLIYAGTRIFDFEKVPAAMRGAVTYYLSLVGGHDYAFFSPDIPTQVLVRCQVIYPDGHSELVSFDHVGNTFQLRSNYVFQIFDAPDSYDVSGRIASDYCFAQHPNANKVKVSIDRYIVPSIQEYKNGKGYGLDELYTHIYTHE